jgi:hypothetical protein
MFEDQISAALLDFARKHDEVLGLFLFGSHARGRARASSDVDVAVYIEPNAFAADANLELQLRYGVELEGMTHKSVDVVILNQAPPTLRHQIFRKGKLIFERDRVRVRRFIGDALVEFYDEIVTLQAAQDALIRRHLLGR